MLAPTRLSIDQLVDVHDPGWRVGEKMIAGATREDDDEPDDLN